MNIKIDSIVDQNQYIDLLVKFYCAVYHQLYVALKAQGKAAAADEEITDLEISKKEFEDAI